MEQLGMNIDASGSVMSRDKLEDQRRKRGECVTCGRKCFQKKLTLKLFTMIPINDHGRVLNGRCLNCRPLDPSDNDGMLPAVSRPATREDLARFSQSQNNLRTSGSMPVVPPVRRKQQHRHSMVQPGSLNPPEGRPSSSRAVRPSSARGASVSQPPSSSSFGSSGSSLGSAAAAAGAVSSSSLTAALGPHTTGISNQSLGSAPNSSSYRGTPQQDGGGAPPRLRNASSGPTRGSSVRHGTDRVPPPESAYHQDSHYDGHYDQYDSHYHGGSGRFGGGGGGGGGGEYYANGSAHDDGMVPSPLDRSNSQDSMERALRGGPDDQVMRSHASQPASGVEEEETYAVRSGELTPAEAMDYYRRTYQETQVSLHSLGDLAHQSGSSRSLQSAQSLQGPSGRPIGERRNSTHSASSMSSYADQEFHEGQLNDQRYEAPSFTGQSHPLLEAHLDNVVRRPPSENLSTSQHSGGARSHVGSSCGEDSQSDFAIDGPEDAGMKRLRSVANDYVQIVSVMRDHSDSAQVQCTGMHELSELHLTAEDSMRLLHIGAMQVIVDAMYHFPEDLQLQVYGCRSMWNASGTADNQLNFVEVGALDIILQDMENFNKHVDLQEQALATLANLGANESNLDLMVEKGIVTRIIETMNKHSDTVEVQIKGCLAIANMASHMTTLKKTIQETGGGGAVVISMVMHPGNPVLQEKALRALRNLSANCDENKVELSNIGGVDAVISAMQVHRDFAGVQEAGAWTLSNLAGNADCKSLIGDIGGVDVLIRAMWVHSDNASVTEWCCRALYTLSLDQRNSSLVLDVGGISAVVNAMQAHVDSSVVQEMGCGVLGNLPSDDRCKMRIVDEEALDAIVLAMVLYSDTAEVQERACQVLLQLAIKENLKSMHASNVAELVRTAAQKFPDNCNDLADQLLKLLETYVEEYG